MENSTIFKQETKENTLFEGEIRNFNYNKEDEIQKELLLFIKEKGLTISQAKELLTNTINRLDEHSILITVSDYEKLTGRDPFVNPDS